MDCGEGAGCEAGLCCMRGFVGLEFIDLSFSRRAARGDGFTGLLSLWGGARVSLNVWGDGVLACRRRGSVGSGASLASSDSKSK